jgi:hypothetical protein
MCETGAKLTQVIYSSFTLCWGVIPTGSQSQPEVKTGIARNGIFNFSKFEF